MNKTGDVVSTATLAVPIAPVSAPLATTPPSVAQATGTITVDSFPWSRVTSIRNSSTGAAIPVNELLTPARIAVPPGHYEVNFQRDGRSEKRQVEVPDGGAASVSVQFPAAYETLPDFGGEQ